jgi:hypothetical protein
MITLPKLKPDDMKRHAILTMYPYLLVDASKERVNEKGSFVGWEYLMPQ